MLTMVVPKTAEATGQDGDDPNLVRISPVQTVDASGEKIGEDDRSSFGPTSEEIRNTPTGSGLPCKTTRESDAMSLDSSREANTTEAEENKRKLSYLHKKFRLDRNTDARDSDDNSEAGPSTHSKYEAERPGNRRSEDASSDGGQIVTASSIAPTKGTEPSVAHSSGFYRGLGQIQFFSKDIEAMLLDDRDSSPPPQDLVAFKQSTTHARSIDVRSSNTHGADQIKNCTKRADRFAGRKRDRNAQPVELSRQAENCEQFLLSPYKPALPGNFQQFRSTRESSDKHGYINASDNINIGASYSYTRPSFGENRLAVKGWQAGAVMSSNWPEAMATLGEGVKQGCSGLMQQVAILREHYQALESLALKSATGRDNHTLQGKMRHILYDIIELEKRILYYQTDETPESTPKKQTLSKSSPFWSPTPSHFLHSAFITKDNCASLTKMSKRQSAQWPTGIHNAHGALRSQPRHHDVTSEPAPVSKTEMFGQRSQMKDSRLNAHCYTAAADQPIGHASHQRHKQVSSREVSQQRADIVRDSYKDKQGYPFYDAPVLGYMDKPSTNTVSVSHSPEAAHVSPRELPLDLSAKKQSLPSASPGCAPRPRHAVVQTGRERVASAVGGSGISPDIACSSPYYLVPDTHYFHHPLAIQPSHSIYSVQVEPSYQPHALTTDKSSYYIDDMLKAGMKRSFTTPDSNSCYEPSKKAKLSPHYVAGCYDLKKPAPPSKEAYSRSFRPHVSPSKVHLVQSPVDLNTANSDITINYSPNFNYFIDCKEGKCAERMTKTGL